MKKLLALVGCCLALGFAAAPSSDGATRGSHSGATHFSGGRSSSGGHSYAGGRHYNGGRGGWRGGRGYYGGGSGISINLGGFYPGFGYGYGSPYYDEYDYAPVGYGYGYGAPAYYSTGFYFSGGHRYYSRGYGHRSGGYRRGYSRR
jgi:hypothetical protein